MVVSSRNCKRYDWLSATSNSDDGVMPLPERLSGRSIVQNWVSGSPNSSVHQAKQSLPPGIDLVKADDFREWQVDIRVLDANPLYLDQTFRLSFIFSDNYPIGGHTYTTHAQIPMRHNSLLLSTKIYPRDTTKKHENDGLTRPLNSSRSTRSSIHLRPSVTALYHTATAVPAAITLTISTTNAFILPRPAYTDPPAHLQQWNYMPRPARHSGLVARPERRKRLHEHTEHVDGKHQERAAPRR